MARLTPTNVLIGLNSLVFVLMVFSGVSPLAPQTREMVRWGANFAPLSLGPQPWRVLTANYLHFGIVHLGLNMWCLWNLGSLAGRIFERWTYVLTYTLCGIAGSVVSLSVHPRGIGAGASGAIFGMAGALIAALALGKFSVPRAQLQPTITSLVTFAGYNLLFGLIPGIDNAAHVGGFVCGLAMGAALAPRPEEGPEVRARRRNLVGLGMASLLSLTFFLLRR